MIKLMDTDNIMLEMELYTKVNGKTIWEAAKVNKNGLMEPHSKGYIAEIKSTVEENSNGATEMSILENSKIIKKMGKG